MDSDTSFCSVTALRDYIFVRERQIVNVEELCDAESRMKLFRMLHDSMLTGLAVATTEKTVEPQEMLGSVEEISR